MQRNIVHLQQGFWTSPSGALRAAGREHPPEADNWPTPGTLFLEAGLVLAVALGASVIIELLMTRG
jgi:hypothetical protein